MDYIPRDIGIELWSKIKAKATLEHKTMREVIFRESPTVYNVSGSRRQS